MSGACEKSCSSACHRGRSPRVCEHTWWKAARGGGRSRRGASARLASGASPEARELLGGHTSPLVSAFLPLRRSTGEPRVFSRRLRVHDPKTWVSNVARKAASDTVLVSSPACPGVLVSALRLGVPGKNSRWGREKMWQA